MFLDRLTRLVDTQAITGSAVTTNSYDLGSSAASTPGRRVGGGEPLSVVFVVEVAAAGDSGTSGDGFVFRAVSSTASTLASSTTIIQRTVAMSLLTAGAIVEVPLPVGTPTQRYLGGQVDLATGGDTISVSVYIMPRSMVQDWVSYAKGYAI